jgi:phosphoglycolate phosphatase-like HAD superfamily hydrolase
MTGRLVFGLTLALTVATAASEANLASWRDGPAKATIVQFVRDVTDERSTSFVPAAERIAVFDNDGTLWSEQPVYFQAAFMLDRLKAMAPEHPEWRDNPAYQALLARDEAQLARVGIKPVLELLAVANAGMTTEEYGASIRAWLKSAVHPRFKRPYTDLVYQPMQELLAYLREHGFQTWIVSGGGIEFMRAWTEAAYGIPPQQVIGSIAETKFELRGGEPALVREPSVAFVDDGPGKPVGIYRAIGRRPIAAFGNSDGDLQMLQYAAVGEGSRLAVIVHHDDMEREYAYDRESRVGRLDKALDEAKARKWVVVSMKDDWKRVYPWENLR